LPEEHDRWPNNLFESSNTRVACGNMHVVGMHTDSPRLQTAGEKNCADFAKYLISS
jgi:hypothetical protein